MNARDVGPDERDLSDTSAPGAPSGGLLLGVRPVWLLLPHSADSEGASERRATSAARAEVVGPHGQASQLGYLLECPLSPDSASLHGRSEPGLQRGHRIHRWRTERKRRCRGVREYCVVGGTPRGDD